MKADASAELHCLDSGPLGELGPGDPRPKAEVVLDSRGGPRLAASRDPVVLLVTDFLLGDGTAAIATGAVGVLFAVVWYAIPVSHRVRLEP